MNRKFAVTGQAGITLIELLIALAIVAIISAVAYPAYTDQVQRSRRTDAKVALVAAAQAVERYYTEHNSYTGATLGTNGVYAATSSNGYYALSLTIDRSVVVPAGTSYLLQAVPQGSQASDTPCGTFSLNEQGLQAVSAGSDSATVSKCWGG